MDNNGLQVMFKKQGQDLVQIKPTECLMKAAGFEVDQKIDVHYEIESKTLVLIHRQSSDMHVEVKEDTYDTDKGKVEIYLNVAVEHSRDECPLYLGNYLPSLKKIFLAACVLLFDSTDHILLTQRHQALSYPNSWVAPGGKVDPGESILEAAVRELREETGVIVSSDCLQPVMVYESNAEILEDGVSKAKNNILVMFYASHLTDKQKHEVEVNVQEAEVQSYEWVHEDVLYALLDHSQTEAELLDAHGEATYQNYSRMYPNIFERGLPEGHVLAFKSYYRTKKGI
jgi:8-oxo-dGTP pyrophosphatase MutT (NUDIX family)